MERIYPDLPGSTPDLPLDLPPGLTLDFPHGCILSLTLGAPCEVVCTTTWARTWPPHAAQERLPKCGDRFRAPLSQTSTKSVTTFDFCICGSLEAFTAMSPRKLRERRRLKTLEHPVLHVPPPTPRSLVPTFSNIKRWGGCGGSTPAMVFFPKEG